MADAHDAWNDVGDSFAALGRTLKQRLDAGDQAPGGEAVQEALRKLGEAAERLGTNASQLLRDPELKDTVERVGKSLSNALATSFEEVGDQVSGFIERTRSKGSSGSSE